MVLTSIFNYPLTMLLMLILISILPALAADKSNLSFFTQELAVISSDVAKKIFNKSVAKTVESNLVKDLFFKNDEYVYCQRGPQNNYLCAVYLKFNGLGELSSFYRDVDYGKGILEEALTTKPIIEGGEVAFMANGFYLFAQGKQARFLYQKMDQIYEDSFENDLLVTYQKEGVQVSCSNTYLKRRGKIEYFCSILVEMDQNNGDGDDKHHKHDILNYHNSFETNQLF